MATEEVRGVNRQQVDIVFAKGQCAAILAHLKRGRQLSSLNALNLFGCFRLAARIHDLRARGHKIESASTTLSNKKRISVYWM